MVERFWALLQQSGGTSARTSVLSPLIWILVIVVGGTTACIAYDAPDYAIVSMIVLLFLLVLSSIYFFFVYTHKDPDALRSEKYALTKMAIQHGRVGDDQQGLIEPEEAISVKQVESSPKLIEADSKTEKGDQEESGNA